MFYSLLSYEKIFVRGQSLAKLYRNFTFLWIVYQYVIVSCIPNNLITTWPYSLYFILLFFTFQSLPMIVCEQNCTKINVCFFRTWRVNKSRLAYETSSNLLWFNSMRIQKSLGTTSSRPVDSLHHFGPS